MELVENGKSISHFAFKALRIFRWSPSLNILRADITSRIPPWGIITYLEIHKDIRDCPFVQTHEHKVCKFLELKFCWGSTGPPWKCCLPSCLLLLLLFLLNLFHLVDRKYVESKLIMLMLWSLNNEVVIGIIDQPIIAESGCNLSSFGEKYLPASYVKLVESTGARVVPIPFDASRQHLFQLFHSVNAIIFPGGDADFTPGTLFYDNAHYLFNLTLQANDKGDYFPLIGICQGMEVSWSPRFI